MLSVFVNKDKHLAMLQSNSIVLSVYREGINIVVKEYVYREMGQAHKERENSFTEVLPFPAVALAGARQLWESRKFQTVISAP